MKLLNFKVGTEEEAKHVCDGRQREFIDERTKVICVEPTYDLQCYINYLEMLNCMRDKWKNFGYLDLGMVPVAYFPSFFPSEFRIGIVKAFKQVGLQTYLMPAISFTNEGYKSQELDAWAFREDVAKCYGLKDKDHFSIIDILKGGM